MDSNGSQNSTPVQAASSGQIKDRSSTVALALVWIYPIGVILMWLWMKSWGKGIKVLVTIPVIIALIGFISAIFITSINPTAKLEKARQQYEGGNTQPVELNDR